MTTAKIDQTGRESLAARIAPVACVPLVCAGMDLRLQNGFPCMSLILGTAANAAAKCRSLHHPCRAIRLSQGTRLPVSRKLDAGGVHRFSIGFQHPVTVKGTLMPKRIRLACSGCDTDEGDEVSSIPTTWKDVTEVQSLAEYRKKVTADDKTRSAFEWYTHLGICPRCQKEDN